jgi:hypothetical protein
MCLFYGDFIFTCTIKIILLAYILGGQVLFYINMSFEIICKLLDILVSYR